MHWIRLNELFLMYFNHNIKLRQFHKGDGEFPTVQQNYDDLATHTKVVTYLGLQQSMNGRNPVKKWKLVRRKDVLNPVEKRSSGAGRSNINYFSFISRDLNQKWLSFLLRPFLYYLCVFALPLSDYLDTFSLSESLWWKKEKERDLHVQTNDFYCCNEWSGVAAHKSHKTWKRRKWHRYRCAFVFDYIVFVGCRKDVAAAVSFLNFWLKKCAFEVVPRWRLKPIYNGAEGTWTMTMHNSYSRHWMSSLSFVSFSHRHLWWIKYKCRRLLFGKYEQKKNKKENFRFTRFLN